MTTPEDTTYEQIRLNYIARKLEKLSSPREITIASIRYQEQLEEALAREKRLKALLDRATDERYELHNSLIESRVGKAREIAQATEAITEILRNLN